jgi:hypothetical protein
MVTSAYHETLYLKRLIIGYINLQARVVLGTPLRHVISSV